MGKHVIYEAFPKAQSDWTENQLQLYKTLVTEVQSKPKPPSKLHLVYVLGELFKIVSLGRFIWILRNIVP